MKNWKGFLVTWPGIARKKFYNKHGRVIAVQLRDGSQVGYFGSPFGDSKFYLGGEWET